ncbi:hypothetical protein N431DRAFT_557447 [Stipitochalara longipes BDJ]|nr:hypothetical protein N431DRAFT_557447 [Stipitochalara longipes BDJ]
MATPFISVTDTSTSISSEPTTRYDNGHPNSPWRRIAIIPIWIVQLAFLAVNAVVAGMLIGITQSGSGPGKNEVQPWTIVNIVFASIALTLTCVEVLMFVHHDLSPKLFLLSTVIKIVMGLIPIGFQIYVTQTSWVHISPNGLYLAIAFGFSIAEYIGYIAALVYGLYVFKNVRNHMKGLYDSYTGDSEATRLTHAYS